MHENYIYKEMYIINNLYFEDDKPPHMLWDEFKNQLNWAVDTYDRI